jgi:predicted ArsR family transcriptional regulator
MRTYGLGPSQRAILEHLKRAGQSTIPELASAVGLNIETVRGHVKALSELGLIRRQGTRSTGPGRPEVLYRLTADSDALFPRHEGAILRDLAAHLVATGNGQLIQDFFARRIAADRPEAMARVRGLEGRERVEEVARIFSELGFMAEVEDATGVPYLRLCHCPIRELVETTKIPCRAELQLIEELLGARLARMTYLPAGDPSCSYRMES